jgi:hypothetical protein
LVRVRSSVQSTPAAPSKPNEISNLLLSADPAKIPQFPEPSQSPRLISGENRGRAFAARSRSLIALTRPPLTVATPLQRSGTPIQLHEVEDEIGQTLGLVAGDGYHLYRTTFKLVVQVARSVVAGARNHLYRTVVKSAS